MDLGLPIDTNFLHPQKSIRYHAQEFYSSNRRPTSENELYNYKHSSLRMVTERSFRVLKACFPILNLMSNFKRSRQRYIIIVCCTLHNFIRINNRGDELFSTWRETEIEGSASNSQGNGNTRASSNSETQMHVMEMSDKAKRLMPQFRDDITNAIWVDYVVHGH